MQSTAPSRQGTTLYLSELANGFVFTLSIRDVGRGEHEKHIWKTSYPLLELLYPYWVKKRPINTPIDFLAHSLRQAEQAFGWKLVTDSGKFRVPETQFGEGIDTVRILQNDSVKSALDNIVSDKFVTIKKRSELSIGKELLEKIDMFTQPVVVVVLDFFSYEIIECIPKSVGNTRRWEYKSSKIQYKNAQEYVDMLAAKKFLPFVSEHIPEGQMFNTLLNHAYWRPLTTSSNLVKDLFRALTTALLIDLSQYTSLQASSKGHIYVTGEIPLFVRDSARLQLAVVDGLGLSGTWSITIDEQNQFLPFLADEQEVDVFHELSAEKSSLWIIPQTKKVKSIVNVKAESKEYRGIYGNLYTYSHQPKLHDFEIGMESEKSTYTLPNVLSVTAVTIDMRTWPVIYGPNTVANSDKIPQWIDRIRKQIKTT